MEGIFGLRDWHLCGRGRSGHGAGGPYAQDGDPRAGTSKPRSQGIKPLESRTKRNDDQIYAVLGITHPSVLCQRCFFALAQVKNQDLRPLGNTAFNSCLEC